MAKLKASKILRRIVFWGFILGSFFISLLALLFVIDYATATELWKPLPPAEPESAERIGQIAREMMTPPPSDPILEVVASPIVDNGVCGLTAFLFCLFLANSGVFAEHDVWLFMFVWFLQALSSSKEFYVPLKDLIPQRYRTPPPEPPKLSCDAFCCPWEPEGIWYFFHRLPVLLAEMVLTPSFVILVLIFLTIIVFTYIYRRFKEE